MQRRSCWLAQALRPQCSTHMFVSSACSPRIHLPVQVASADTHSATACSVHVTQSSHPPLGLHLRTSSPFSLSVHQPPSTPFEQPRPQQASIHQSNANALHGVIALHVYPPDASAAQYPRNRPPTNTVAILFRAQIQSCANPCPSSSTWLPALRTHIFSARAAVRKAPRPRRQCQA